MQFKILSIDGGGIKGIFPASFLAALEQDLKKPVADYFDLIVGTSTGGIIALGLGLGLSPQEILNFYVKNGPKIFPPKTRWLRWLRHLLWPAYDSSALRTAIESVFGDRTLAHSRSRLVIPSTNALNGEVYIFKTPHHVRFTRDFRERVVDVALATAAAPTYFPNHVTDDNRRLLDGGMWANNPIMVGVVEALATLGQNPQDVRVLSLGCTDTPIQVGRMKGRIGGRLAWVLSGVEWLMHGQSECATNQARLLIGKENVSRIQPTVPPGVYELDGTDAARDLIGLGSSEARKALPLLVETFFSAAATPFVPSLVTKGPGHAATIEKP